MTVDSQARDLTGVPVLVTGAGGFIGSHLVEQLVARGADVRAFVRYNSRSDPGLLRYLSQEALDDVDLYFGDLRDFDAVRQAVAGREIIFHLGALIGIPYSYQHPYDVVQTNVLGTSHVLLAARDHGVARLVHTSTSEVYGSAQYVPIDEAHPLRAQSPYSASKIGADKLAESFHLSYGLPVITVRPFNTYGPRQSARAVIPTVIAQAMTQREVRLGALSPRRDFTFVRDTVAGFIAAASADAVSGEVVNIGNGKDISIGELAELIISLVGRDIEIVHDEDRERPDTSEVDRLQANAAKARRLLGWTPEVSLAAGIRETIDWIAAHADLYDAHYAV